MLFLLLSLLLVYHIWFYSQSFFLNTGLIFSIIVLASKVIKINLYTIKMLLIYNITVKIIFYTII